MSRPIRGPRGLRLYLTNAARGYWLDLFEGGGVPLWHAARFARVVGRTADCGLLALWYEPLLVFLVCAPDRLVPGSWVVRWVLPSAVASKALGRLIPPRPGAARADAEAA